MRHYTRSMKILVGLLASAVGLVGCSSSHGSAHCVPGNQVVCGCEGAQSGTQICADDGKSFGGCSCDAGFDGSDSSGGDEVDIGADGGSAPAPEAGECSAVPIRAVVVDAEYSDSLDRIVLVDSADNELVMLDPTNGKTRTVALPLAPVAVSVSPDGKTAAVAHNASVSIVDLTVPMLIKTIRTQCDASDIVLATNGFAYVFPAAGGRVEIHTIDIEAGVDRANEQLSNISAGTSARLHPSGQFMYGITGLSPPAIERYTFSPTWTASTSGRSPYHGDYPICGRLWFSRDGARLFNGCGTVFQIDPGANDDMSFDGELEGVFTSAFDYAAITALVHDEPNGRVYAIPEITPFTYDVEEDASERDNEDTWLDMYSFDSLRREKSIRIPCLKTSQGKQLIHGRFVFTDSRGEALYVLGRRSAYGGATREWVLVEVKI